MSATLLLVACLAAQTHLERVREMLTASDYHSAWEALAGESEGLARSRIRAEILYRAGDPAGSLNAARAGLEIDPGQIELLYYAAGAAVWLEDEADAVAYSDRLLRAAETVSAQGHEERGAWQEAAREMAERSRALTARESELSHSLARLRLVAIGGIASWLVALGCFLRSQGRSSKPVS